MKKSQKVNRWLWLHLGNSWLESVPSRLYWRDLSGCVNRPERSKGSIVSSRIIECNKGLSWILIQDNFSKSSRLLNPKIQKFVNGGNGWSKTNSRIFQSLLLQKIWFLFLFLVFNEPFRSIAFIYERDMYSGLVSAEKFGTIRCRPSKIIVTWPQTNRARNFSLTINNKPVTLLQSTMLFFMDVHRNFPCCRPFECIYFLTATCRQLLAHVRKKRNVFHRDFIHCIYTILTNNLLILSIWDSFVVGPDFCL